MAFLKRLTLSIILSAAFVSCLPPLQLEPLVGIEPNNRGGSDGIGILEGVRLPQNVLPSHYDLEITPIINLPDEDPRQFTAPGKVAIRLRCMSSTNTITLHAEEIDIQHAGVTVRSVSPAGDIPVIGHSNDSTLAFYTMTLGSALTAGLEYDLTIPFTALVRGDRLDGLYRSSYRGTDGNPRWLATTQFQKLGARMAFPCFDEPNMRATFNITIGRHVDYTSLCNSPLRESVPIEGMPNWYWDIYGATVNMPTYLIAIIVSDFSFVDAPAGITNYDVKTWGPPTMTDNATGEFSARAAAEILEFYENYFASIYQFPKLDSVAIPDFDAGAMENWALNTYRIVLMLWWDGESTQFEQWRQAAVIAHEITHHWFGNLVTCDWWNDLWLNEGFARYMQFLGANASLPNHGIIERYTLDTIQLAMIHDAGPTTEPVRSNRTDIVNQQSSRIIYEKAGALIRMMQGFLSEETLIAGLRNYLDNYAYGNVVQDNLFEDLQAQADADGNPPTYSVKEIMDSWTLKSGFPIIRIRRAGTNALLISQEKFLLLNQQGGGVQQNELWYVPLSYATKSNPDFSPSNGKPKFWLDKFTLSTIKVIPETTNEWIVFNPDAKGYFRVLYDSNLLGLIVDQLVEDNTVISVSSKSQIIDDYFKSTWEGYATIENAMELTRFLQEETSNAVWTSAFNNLRVVNQKLQDAPFYPSFKDYLLSKVTPVLDRLGWEQDEANDRPVDVILRAQLLDWACSLGSERCTQLATDYATWLADSTRRVPGDIQAIVYCKAVSIADTLTLPNGFDIVQFVNEGYATAWRAERFTVFINSIACEAPENVEAPDGLLDRLIEETSGFTNAHAISIIQRVADNPANRDAIIDFIRLQLFTMVELLGETSISSAISSMAQYTSEATQVDNMRQVIDFALERVNSTNVKNSLVASRGLLDANIAWMSNYGQRIQAWLSQP